MVKNIEEKVEIKQVKTSSYKGLFLGVVLLVACGGFGYLWYQNPKILSKFNSNDKESAALQNLQSQINELNLKVQNLEKTANEQVNVNDLAMLNDKVNTSLKFNEQILNAKADTSSVLGLMNRVDSLETSVKNLGQVSSQGALVLTAAMLVKDSAYKGAFVYEAEVLRALAYGTAMQAPAEEIYQLSSSKILCKRKLTEEFNYLYENMEKNNIQADTKEVEDKEEPANWKDKITSKLNELVVIEKHEEKNNPQEENLKKDDIYRLVNGGYFALAIDKMAQNEAYNNEAFEAWEEKVFKREIFEQALKQIEALTLAFMKAESLQTQE